jgi:alpha-beta hydrolase superfamily lysophospholipase
LKKALKYSAILIVTLSIAILLLAHFVLPYAIIERQKWAPELLQNTENYESEHLEFITRDSLVMRGSILSPKQDAKNSFIICLHGIGANRSQFYGISEKLVTEGYSTLLMDLRGHGLSGGEYTTYGYHEKNDVRVIVDSLKKRYPKKTIGIWGYSLGGAVALQSLAQDDRLEYGIIESTFSSMDQVVYDYQARYTGGLSFPFLCDIALDSADEIADFNHEQVVPSESAKEITQPIFMAHGKDDKRIPIENGRQIFENLGSQSKQFIEVKSANHTNVRIVGGNQYFKNILEFLDGI